MVFIERQRINEIKSKLKVDPDSIVLLSQLAEAYNLTGKYKKAIESSSKILKDGKRYKPAYNNLFYAYDMLEDFDNALEVLKNYLESFLLVKRPELQKYSYSLWASHFFKENREVPPFYTSSLPFSKPSVVIDINFSTCFHFSKIGWSERSNEALSLILEYYPQDINMLNALGYNYFFEGQFSKAKESLDKALSISKTNFKTHLFLGGVYKKMGKYKESEEEYNYLIQKFNPINFTLTDFFRIQTHVSEENAKDVVNLISAHIGLGFLYNEMGEYEQAIEQFLKVRTFFKSTQLISLGQNPFLTEVYHGLGIAYRALGNDKLALKVFKKAVINDRLNEDVLASLGKLYFEMKNYKHAIKTLQRVVEIKPENHVAWHLLSKAHYENREIKNAIETNIKCLSIDPNFEPALKLREKLSDLQ